MSGLRMTSIYYDDFVFSHVHPQISRLFTLNDVTEKPTIAIDWTGLTFVWTGGSSCNISVAEVVLMAKECENNLLDHPDVLERPQADLWQLASSPDADTAMLSFTMIAALNQLESAIRQKATSSSPGNAPMLTNMIAKIPSPLREILQKLLLPHDGLNLRNLWWHGFIGEWRNRSWLALVLVLCRFLGYSGHDEASERRAHIVGHIEGFEPVRQAIQLGKEYSDDSEVLRSIESWIPETHRGLWKLSQSWLGDDRFSTSICTVWTIILEHTLRIEWCDANRRPEDKIARPSSYYVTLDGHGQRNQHDVLLHPDLMDGSSNGLIDIIGGSCWALLTDLYASSGGGPNLRAALAHGVMDFAIEREVGHMTNPHTAWVPSTAFESNQNLVYLILSVMGTLSTTNGEDRLMYRPVFSQCTQVRMRTGKIHNTLRYLDELVNSTGEGDVGLLENFPTDELASLSISRSNMEEIYDFVRSKLDLPLCKELYGKCAEFSVANIHSEHDINVRLSSSGALLMLLQELEHAIGSCVTEMTKSLEILKGIPKERQRRRARRAIQCAASIRSLYSFAYLVVLLNLKYSFGGEKMLYYVIPRTDLLKATERTRMIVSTVASILFVNAERTYRPIREYARGKAVRAILDSLFDDG